MGDEAFFRQAQCRAAARWRLGHARRGVGRSVASSRRVAAPPRSEERARLVGDLVRPLLHRLQSGRPAGQDEAYVSLDIGLSIISQHARSLATTPSSCSSTS